MMGAGSKAATKMHLWVGVLGPVHAERDDGTVDLGGPKQRAVLAMLVAGRGRAVSRDQIIEGVWGEAGSEANRRSFHTYVSNLRAVLGDVIVRTGDTYLLEIDAGSVDSLAFESAVDEARRLLATDPGLVAVSLREALALWQGRPYADLTDVPGLEPEVRRLEELRLEAVELRIDAELASGLHGSLIAEVEALAEEHPMRERFRAQHMLALYRSGRQSEALRAYRRTESFLAEELGVEPSDELRDLELKILQHDESLLGGTGRAVTQRLAVLATDIEGSTRLWDRHPQEMAEVLATHDRILREAMEGQGGKIFRHTGHGVLAAFPTAVAAVGAAEKAFISLAAADWGVVGELRIRVGIDAGEVEARGGEFFGPPLNRAARLCSSGHGGQVLISEAAQTEVVSSARPGIQFRQLGEYRLRGAAAPERIAQLLFAGFPDDFPELRVEADSALRDRFELVSLPGYEVRERLGEGAFGVVWKAYQPSVGREVAVKMIRPELASQPSFVRRFEAEARTIARLGHPHIVPLIDFWRDSDSAYLVMALMAGGSLADEMASGPVDSVTTRRILTQVGSALDHAHSQGIVHGDLRPANVLLDGVGNAYLSDFWITARLLDPTAASSTSSTAGYRAPEVESTGPTSEADRFAFAVLAGELLDRASGLDTVFARGTAVSPGDRYSSAAALLADVDRVLGEPPEIELGVVSRNPYRGMRAFDVTDAADFHGRDELVAALLAAVSEHRMVTVVGPSGSGKSSVVQAGLLPALAREMIDGSEGWVHTVLTPGADPVDALADALEAISVEPVDVDRLAEVGLGGVVDGDVLVVVDQFEELYTLASSDQRHRFLGLVIDAVEDPQGRMRVVATLRADFYDRPLEDPRLGRLVRDGLVTVLPPSGDELVEMITAPALTVGLGFEPGLPYQIAEDVAHEPGGLPLLQYALTELVDHRSSNLLTATDYARVGGVKAALATRAEALFRDLTPDQQRLTRQILLRMVTVDENTDDTRRRVRRTELDSLGFSRADLDTVLDTLISQRLLLTDRDAATRGPTVEIAHEALLREWPRLTGWVNDQRDALTLGRRFRSALTDWEASGRHDDYLLTGSRLALYTGWADTTTLTTDESHYYQVSQAKDQTERTARRRRRRTLTTVLAAATVVASVFGVAAVVQANRANAEAELATAAAVQALEAEAKAEDLAELASLREQEALDLARRARASELSAFATAALPTDPSLSKLLAVASALAGEPSLDTLAVLHRALAADRIVSRYTGADATDVKWFWTHLHPDGTRMVAGGFDEIPSPRLEVFDFTEGRVFWGFDTLETAIGIDRPRFSPDGSHVVAGLFWDSEDGGVPPRQHLGARIWDADTGSEVAHIDLGPCGGWVLDVSATHLLAATMSGEDNRCFAGKFDDDVDVALELVDLVTGERQVLAPVFWGGGIFSGDGRRVAYSQRITDPARSGPDIVTDVIDLATLERVLELDFDDALGVSFLYANALNHDGSLLLASDRPIEVWDVNAGQRIATFDEHAGGARAMFSPAGDGTVYSVGQSAILRHWVATTGEEIASYPAIVGVVPSVADGRVLVSDPGARAAVLLDVEPRGEVLVVPAACDGFMPSPMVIAGDFAVFNQSCPDDLKTIVVDLGKGELAYALPGHNAQGLSVSPDGTRFARQDANAPTVDGDPVAGNWLGPVRVRDIHTRSVVVEFQGLCTVNQVRPPLLAQEGCAPLPEGPFPSWIWHLRWSPDGLLVAGIGTYGVAIVWDAHTGEMIHTYEGCDGAYGEHVIFTSDSSELIVFCKGRLAAFDTSSWAEVRASHPEGERGEFGTLWLVGFTADESRLVGIGGAEGWSLFWIDPQTLEVDEALRTFESQPKSWAMSRDLGLAAVGSADGRVRVWDLELRRVVHEVQVGATQVNGVAFLGDRQLAVVVQEGHLSVYTIDPAELLGMARGSLTRGFTETECQRYGFGDDCPRLEELRGEAPGS